MKLLQAPIQARETEVDLRLRRRTEYLALEVKGSRAFRRSTFPGCALSPILAASRDAPYLAGRTAASHRRWE
jgi:hypothetical protein